jgi:hypothetical protein
MSIKNPCRRIATPFSLDRAPEKNKPRMAQVLAAADEQRAALRSERLPPAIR